MQIVADVFAVTALFFLGVAFLGALLTPFAMLALAMFG